MYKIFIVLVGSLLVAFSFNWFLLPHEIMSGGISGISLIISLLTPFNAGLVNFLLNLPILVIGYLKLGRTFIFLSIFSVVVTSLAMFYLPIYALSHEPLLSCVFGGVIGGVGVGLILRASGSTGGFDIIALLLTRIKDISLGNLFFIMNGLVVLVSGFLFTWDLAFYTLISIFVGSKVVDTIHTRHIKLTLTIITSKADDVKEELLKHITRGITEWEGIGAYSKEKRTVLMTVISRYELTDVKKWIKKTDPKAFVNITETVEVLGEFRRN